MKNIKLINASAGSGKTYRLTTLVVDSLKNGIAPESLMATTFTNRAATELRERIRIQLLKNQLPEEACRIYDGYIGTVNSICARLLIEYALEAGVSPALDVMPEEESSKIFKIAIDSVINQYADRMELAARRLEFDGRGNGYQKATDWREHVKTIVDRARENQFSTDVLEMCARTSWDSIQAILGEPLTTDLDQQLHEQMLQAIDRLENMGQLTKTTQKALDKLKDCEKCLKNNRLTWGDWACLSKLSAAKDGQEIISPVNAVADQVLQHPQFQNDIKQIIQGAFECAMKALESYETYKKEHGLMDFVDQETRVLEMAKHNEAFRSSMRDRIQMLMVDEFQDTSPIQLALFLALHELAEHSVWVGDPKQAIYGFRGTDPQLMEEVVALISDADVLDYSWRSRENLLKFTNALFSETFHEMDADKVCLKVPFERTEKAKGGCLEAWHLMADNVDEEAAAVANGVRNLLERIPGLKRGDIAVLCRTNDNCTAIASKLEQLGLRVSVGQGLLLGTRECQLALAALRYMNNSGDTVALAEIIHMSSGHEVDEDWLSELMADPEAAKNKWTSDPMIVALNEGMNQMIQWTPLEALEQAISRIELLSTLKSWPHTDLAISNLDALRRICREYIDQCASHRDAATVEGFITYLRNSKAGQAQGTGEQTVKLVTYHGAKGLEWPWVVLTGLDSAPRDGVFGVHMEGAPNFNPADPLANRRIRYWPWPFGKQKGYPLLDRRINELPIYRIIHDKAEREAKRLLYVGMTRAKDGLVITLRKTVTKKNGVTMKTAWLDTLTDANDREIINWCMETGDQIIQVGRTQIPITVLEYGVETSVKLCPAEAEEQYIPNYTGIAKDYPAARISPSHLSESFTGNNNTIFEAIERFNTRITIKGKPEMDALGNALHSYFATDYALLTQEECYKLVQNIMKRWGVEMAVDPAEIVTAGQHLKDFLNQHYSGYKAFKEWPISIRTEEGQLIQGWIDLLLELQDGYVIIDHKSYSGRDSEERVKKYVPQLSAYKEAVEKATGKPVIDTLLHLPISGLIIRIN